MEDKRSTGEKAAARKEKAAARLFVGNAGLTEAILSAAFGSYGAIQSFNVLKDYAFVQFEASKDAKEAADALNGKSIEGINGNLRVEQSNDNNGGAAKGEKKSCFNCGKAGHYARFACRQNHYPGDDPVCSCS